jgi:AraC family transcriptional regulator
LISSALPDPNLFSDSPQPILQNEVISAHTRGRYQYPHHTTPFLFIGNFNSTGNYQVNRRPAAANDKLFYFLNAGDRLEINFKHNLPLETLLILFSHDFIQSWISYKQTGTGSLLDNATTIAGSTWSIPNIPFEYNAALFKQVSKIKAGMQRQDSDAELFELLETFWAIKERDERHLEQINSKRKSTREEIYRRLLLAKLFMHDNFTGTPTIEEIALEACLDKFHFLKLFKNHFGVTPHQYLVKLKLEHAHALLSTGRHTVLQACQSVGFESHGTFTNLFRKHYHVPPSQVSKLPDSSLVLL